MGRPRGIKRPLFRLYILGPIYIPCLKYTVDTIVCVYIRSPRPVDEREQLWMLVYIVGKISRKGGQAPHQERALSVLLYTLMRSYSSDDCVPRVYVCILLLYLSPCNSSLFPSHFLCLSFSIFFSLIPNNPPHPRSSLLLSLLFFFEWHTRGFAPLFPALFRLRT